MKCSKKLCRREAVDGYKYCQGCRDSSFRCYRRKRKGTPLLCIRCKTGVVLNGRHCDECRTARSICRKEYKTDWTHNNPVKTLLSMARYRAKRDGIVFDIVESDIVIPSHCPILGIPLHCGAGVGGHLPNSPSLDKIIPELGYVRGNIAVISHKANAMKYNETDPLVFRRIADWLERVSRGKTS